MKARHTGKLKDWKSKEQTTEMPKVFVEWVNDNKSRWQANGKAAPFFIRDNYQQGDVDKGLDTRITAAIEEAKLAAATATAKAEKTRPQITEFDTEIDELRNAQWRFDLDLTKLEQLRAESKDRDALEQEVNRLKKEKQTKRREESDALRNARSMQRYARKKIDELAKINPSAPELAQLNAEYAAQVKELDEIQTTRWKTMQVDDEIAEVKNIETKLDTIRQEAINAINKASTPPPKATNIPTAPKNNNNARVALKDKINETEIVSKNEMLATEFLMGANPNSGERIADKLLKNPAFKGLTLTDIFTSRTATDPAHKALIEMIKNRTKHKSGQPLTLIDHFIASTQQDVESADYDTITDRLDGYVRTSHSMALNQDLRAGKLSGNSDIKLVEALDRTINKNCIGKDFEGVRYDDGGFLAFYGIPALKNYGIDNEDGEMNNGADLVGLQMALNSIKGKTFKKTDYTSFSIAKEFNVFTDRPIEQNLHIKAAQNVYIPDNFGESEAILPREITFKVNQVKISTFKNYKHEYVRITIDVEIIANY